VRYVFYWAAVPPEIAGMPTWALNGLSIGGVVSFVLVGLATSRLWTKRQVDIVREDHSRAIETLVSHHTRETADTKARYEHHITTTVDLYKGMVIDALKREQDWRDIAMHWETVAETLSSSLEPMYEQSATTLQVLRAMQAESRKGD